MNTNASLKNVELKVYFDGACHLCSREIEMYERHNQDQKIAWIDISHPEFDAQREGLDPQKVHASFHAKNADGKIMEGVDAFRAIWQTLPSFQSWARWTSPAWVQWGMRQGYRVFAKIRPYLPKKKQCESGACTWSPSAGKKEEDESL